MRRIRSRRNRATKRRATDRNKKKQKQVTIQHLD